MLSSHYWRVAFRKFTDATGRKAKHPGRSRGVCKRYVASELFFERVGIGQILRRFLVQEGNHFLAGRRHRSGALADNLLSRKIALVKFLVRAVVLAERRALQGDSRKQAARAGVSEHLGAHGYIAGSGCVTALGARGCSSVCADLDFALQDSFGAARVHHQDDEVSGLTAELEADASAFEAHHRGCAPGSGKVFAAAAGHGAFAVTSADNESSFKYRRNHNDALGFVERSVGMLSGISRISLRTVPQLSRRSASF